MYNDFDTTCKDERILLRQQAHYWKTQHQRAIQRESEWKEKACQYEKITKQQELKIAELTQENEALKAKIAWLQQQLFGRKSEQTKKEDHPQSDSANENDADTGGEKESSDTDDSSSKPPRKRGKQPGAKGFGRKRHTHLPTVAIPVDLPREERVCSTCRKPFYAFTETKDSEEIHWEVVLIRRIYKRKRYKPTCHCHADSGIVIASVSPKLIRKGMFSCGFWVQLLLEKYLFQRPLYRILQALALEGSCFNQGTLTEGQQKITELIRPLYTRILERSRASNHWQMDETRWMVFSPLEGKTGYRWWLWVVVTSDTCCYLLEPTRSAEVPQRHLGENAEGIINADRYSAYKALGDKIRISFCWGHIRRDFDNIRKGFKKLSAWGKEWVDRINDLFHKNKIRLEQLDNPKTFQQRDQELRCALNAMETTRDRELSDEKLHDSQRKALVSLRNHWEGAILFVDNPEIPMDNNESERRLRNPVIGRKNYYGSGSLWSGSLAAMMFTIFQTMIINDVDPKKFLLAYFQACAENGGKEPDDVDRFLPWNLSEEQKTAWRYPKFPP